MKVVVAGYGKTGIKTIASALNELGYNTYEWAEQCSYLGDDWMKIIRNGGSTEDFRRMFENVDAVTDLMALHYWYEIHQAFPEAKIILTIRDEDSWYKSRRKHWDTYSNNWMDKLIHTLTYTGRKFYKLRKEAHKLYGADFTWPSLRFVANETQAKLCYRRHNAYVQSVAPKDKLLVFDIKDGWEPLCQFLGKEIPSKPFPHLNPRKSQCAALGDDPMSQRMRRELKISLFCLTSLFMLGGYAIYKTKSFWFLRIPNFLK